MIIIVIIIIIFIIKVGLIPTDIYEIAHPEDAATNAARLERLWQVIFASSASSSSLSSSWTS